MASVALLGSTWTTASGSKSASGTPAVGDLIVIGIGHTGNATSTAPTDNQSGTYTKLNSTTKGGGADLVELWVRDQLVSSAVSHIFTHNPGTTTGGGLIVFNASGCAAGGAGGIQQSGTKAQTAAGNTPTVPFGAAISSANPVVAFLVNQSSPAAVTEPTGFTEVLDTGYSTPSAGIEAVKIDSGASGSAVTWASTSATIYCALAAELLAAGGGGTIYNDTLGETVAGSDGLSGAAVFGATLSEAATASAAHGSSATFSSAVTAAATAGSSLVSAAIFPESIAEVAVAGSAVTGGLLLSGTITASATADSAFASAVVFAGSLSENATGGDGNSAAAQFSNLLAETLGLDATLADSLTHPSATVYNDALTESGVLSHSFSGRTLFERGAAPEALEIASPAAPATVSISRATAALRVSITPAASAGDLSITPGPQPAELEWI